MTKRQKERYIASIQARPSKPVTHLLADALIETMQWTIPETTGDIPPLCRAHSAALYERKIIIFGGGIGGKYYDDVFVLDTVSRRWIQPKLAEVPKLVEAPKPAPRRAHTAVIHNTKMWIFGGGNGLTALNDVWTLDVSAKQMRWREVETSRKKPGPRGYHSTNLINNIMVVVGGSDGKDSFTDVWCLNLGEISHLMPCLGTRPSSSQIP